MGTVSTERAGDEALLAAAVSQLQESTATAVASLDRALARLADARECRAEQIARARADARAEFAGMDPGEFADLVAGGVAPRSTRHGSTDQ